jgi:hypothetical protein
VDTLDVPYVFPGVRSSQFENLCEGYDELLRLHGSSFAASGRVNALCRR